LVGQHRSTPLYAARPREFEMLLVAAINELAACQSRYG